jgi:hypothetical protein
MKKLLLLSLFSVAGSSFGQIVFDETYNPTTGNCSGKQVLEFNGKYLVSISNFGGALISFDFNSGNNPILEYSSQYNVISIFEASQNEFFSTERSSGSYIDTTIISKFDNSFNKLWSYFLLDDIDSTDNIDTSYVIRSLKATNDGGCILGTIEREYDIIQDFNTNSTRFIKLNNVGQVEWTKNFPGVSNPYTINTTGGTSFFGGNTFHEIIQSYDGSYIGVGGSDTLYCGSKSLWIFKLDQTGDLIWENYIHPEILTDNTTTGMRWCEAIAEISPNDFILAGGYDTGWNDPFNGFSAGYGVPNLIRINGNGNIVQDSVFTTLQYGEFGTLTLLNGDVYTTYDIENNLNYSNTVLAQIQQDFTINELYTAELLNDDNQSRSMITSSDNAIVFTGVYDDSLWIFKYNPEQTSISELNSNQPKELIKIVNLLGQEVEYTPNTILIYQYSNGTSEKVFTLED